jgi:endonuclease III
VLLREHGRTYAEEAGIRVDRNTPAMLFQLLALSMLLSARISSSKAVEATRALRKAGLTTPRKMAGATWQERVDVLTQHGYKRYDESYARMLGQSADHLIEAYGGDLRRLRDAAEHDALQERKRLQEFKGIGEVGADIFLREVQVAWDEVAPYADARVLDAAQRLGLGRDVDSLAEHVKPRDMPHLVAALVRVDLHDAYDQVRQAAA